MKELIPSGLLFLLNVSFSLHTGKIVDQVKGFLVKDGMFKFVKELKNLGEF